MEDVKKDLSSTCGFSDFEMWQAYMNYEISEADFDVWYDNHCGQCIYGYDICMYGETEIGANEEDC